MITDDVCAIMFECIQGEGGVLNLTKEFVDEIANIAAEKDILIAVDEVQTGNGRMGNLYLMQEFESGIGNNKTVFCRHPEIIHSGLSGYFQPLKMWHLPD